MKIELHKIPIRDLVEDYVDHQEQGVFGYGGKLNIRPAYQREFVYKDTQRNAVIDTVRKGFPLNTLYWSVNEDGSLEVLDGQQRIISICQYVNNDFSIDGFQFGNLPNDQQEQILEYQLMVYYCEGTDSEKLERFKTINIAGEELTDQELRNAVYTGPWLADAKLKFSKTGCPAYGLASDYLKGSPIRQEYLEKTIAWISGGNIREYMSQHQYDSDAHELRVYFQEVIAWIQRVFPMYRKEMKGLDRGRLYNTYKDHSFPNFDDEITRLMMDEDVDNKKGIYEYLLSGKEKYLNIRAFSDNMKREAYERQKGICPICGKHFAINEMEADHITPWHEGGKTIAENCQMLCKEDNRRKGGI